MLYNKNDEMPLVREKSDHQEQARQYLELSQVFEGIHHS
jgi:hypothetical protein